MKIAVVGASGRMGQMLVRQIARTEGVTLAAASERPGSKALGKDVLVGALPAATRAVASKADGWIFPTAQQTRQTAPAAAATKANGAGTTR